LLKSAGKVFYLCWIWASVFDIGWQGLDQLVWNDT